MFNGLLEEILNESTVSPDKITEVMDGHNMVIVTYKPVTKGREHATGPRMIGVFAYGQTKAGNDCIRVYEYAGDTATFVPGWKFLRLDQLLTWKPTGQIFNEPPDEKFNPDGDKTMSLVYKVVKFDEDVPSLTKDDEKGPKTKEELFQTDAEKEIRKRGERIRKQAENPIYLSDLQPDKKKKEEKPKVELYQTDAEKEIRKRGERIRQQMDNPVYISDLKAKQGLEPYKDASKEYTEGPKTAQSVKNDSEQTPSYKDEVAKRFENLRNQIQNAPKIDLSKFDKEKELKNLRKKLGDTSKPIKRDELMRRLRQNDDNGKPDLMSLKRKYGL